MTISTARTHLSAGQADARKEFSPIRMMDVELTGPLPAVRYDGHCRRIWVLGRLHTEPVGVCVVELAAGGLSPDQLGTLLWPELRDPVTERFAAAGLPLPGQLTGDGLEADPATWPFLRRRRAALAAAPFISVVVCTRDRPHRLQIWLSCLSAQQYPRFEVVVVDNAPTSDAVRAFVSAAQGGGLTLRYVREPRAGKSWALNAGIAAAAGEVIAFCDDDGEADRHWLAEIARGFARGDDIGSVTGMVLPARLETPAQEFFEQLGKGQSRGFWPEVLSVHGPQNPLYPVPPFGIGANMAFRREALARIGGFDVALGPGTLARAAEDLLALSLVLLAGYRIAYEPAAVMRHDHRQDLEGLRRQLDGYGIGLTAYYAALLRHRPSVLPALLRLAPTGLGYLRRANSRRTTTPVVLLDGLRRRQRLSMLLGPAAYLGSVSKQAHIAAGAARRARAAN